MEEKKSSQDRYSVESAQEASHEGQKPHDAHAARLGEGDAVFGDERGHTIKYRRLSWPAVAALMICEIVSVRSEYALQGTLSLPSSVAVIGLAPGLILIIFLGLWATWTSFLLIDFKLAHPEVHSMGDAGLILFGRPGREILAAGTVIFAIMAAGTEIYSGQLTLTTLSDASLCSWKFGLIVTAFVFLLALPRALAQITSLAVFSVVVIFVSCLLGMIGAGVTTDGPAKIVAAQSASFYEAFLAVTSPVFAYAGHFMFFILISEMRNPRDAKKAAVCLQGFATTWYVLFTTIFYVYYGKSFFSLSKWDTEIPRTSGADVASPAFSSLPIKWAKATYAIALANFWVAAALYVHTASKLLFVRLFRSSTHMHEHTALGWGVWIFFCGLGSGAAYVLATAVPIFNSLYTYGLAGAFWLHDFRGRWGTNKPKFVGCVLTVLGGAFICVAGTYTSIKQIVVSYQTGEVTTPFTC